MPYAHDDPIIDQLRRRAVETRRIIGPSLYDQYTNEELFDLIIGQRKRGNVADRIPGISGEQLQQAERILQLLADGPMTSNKIASHFTDCHPMSIVRLLTVMKDEDVILGDERSIKNRRGKYTWSLPKAQGDNSKRPYVDRVPEMLEDGPKTRNEIAAELGCTPENIGQALRRLEKAGQIRRKEITSKGKAKRKDKSRYAWALVKRRKK